MSARFNPALPFFNVHYLDGEKFFLSHTLPDITFTWNDATDQDWKKIKRLFIASYVNTYASLYLADSKKGATNLPEEFKSRAINYMQRCLALKLDWSKPLTKFYMLDFTKFKRTLETSPETSSEYQIAFTQIVYLHALIYLFTADFKRLKEEIAQNEARSYPFHYLIAKFHEQPIGFIVTISTFHSKKIELFSVTLSPAFQAQGLGRRMLEEVTKHYPHLGYLEVITRQINTPAHSFYERCGLHFTGEILFSGNKDPFLVFKGNLNPRDGKKFEGERTLD